MKYSRGKHPNSHQEQCGFQKGHITWLAGKKGYTNSGSIRKRQHHSPATEFKKGQPKEKHPNWKGGLPDCLNCGKQLSRRKYKRCKKCSRKGILNWKYRGYPRSYYNKIARLRKRKAGKLDLKTIQLVYEDNIKQYGALTCYLCLKPIEFRQDCLEHKIPLIRGGTNNYNNLAIAHRSCNAKKKDKTYKEYLAIEEIEKILPK